MATCIIQWELHIKDRGFREISSRAVCCSFQYKINISYHQGYVSASHLLI